MLYLSDRAVYERDRLPFLSEEQVSARDRKRYRHACGDRRDRASGGVSIGYFSGSITHNEDFEMVLPVLTELMEANDAIRLHVVGELDLPVQLEPFKDRVERHPFSPWERLPKMIAQVDINIVPLKDTLFNRAKSENKWLEASLVKVPTVASDVGSLSEVVKQGETGLLCKTVDDWRQSLLRLITSSEDRMRIAENAYLECRNFRTTLYSGKNIAEFIRKIQTPNIAMVMPSLDISGGNLVTLRHAVILSRHGYDVTVLDGFGEDNWVEADGLKLPVLNRRVNPGEIDDCQFRGFFDKAVATFWQTLSFVEQYRRIGKKYYFVQGYETDFYSALDPSRVNANATYGGEADINYLTMSPWCQSWLVQRFGKHADLALNGIDLGLFNVADRDYSGKIRILIEGDCGSDYKNVDESFRIVDKLDPEKYEIWYLSYTGESRPYYRADKFLSNVPYEEVGEVYRQCHILLKTSILESFSYPPLEMMATGGLVVVLRNCGNAEYIEDGKNGLVFEQGEDDKAVFLIESLCESPSLREQLVSGGLDTARKRSWTFLEESVLALYR